MSTHQKYHRAIRCVAIFIGAVNLVSCFTLDLREWFVYFDPWFVHAVICPTFVIVLPSLPFLLPLAHRGTASAAARLSLVLVTLTLIFFEVMWFLMIAIATFFRGPYWSFYWPWEERVLRIPALKNVNLSDWLWFYQLDQPLPENPFIREWLGILLVVLHLLVVPLVASWLWRRKRAKMAYWRMLTFAMFFQILAALPMKIALRWLFDFKYFVALPEYFINI